MTQIRVWAEFLPFDELKSRRVLELLSEFDVGLNVAVHHDAPFPEVAALLSAYENANVDIALWALISKEEGYFPSGRTFPAFKKRVHELLDKIEAEKLRVPAIAVDLEPPLYLMEGLNWKKHSDRRRLRAELRGGLSKEQFDEWTRAFGALRDELADRGARTLVAASPTVPDDLRAGDFFTQGLMGTPVTTVDWDVVSIMWYVSMVTGFSKGLIPYKVARYHLWRDALELKRALGADRASVSLGVTWTGVLGNEPYYEKPEDIRPDAEAAKAAGIKHIWIYNLEGILKAQKPARWFEVIKDCDPVVPEENWQTRLHISFRNLSLRAARWYFK